MPVAKEEIDYFAQQKIALHLTKESERILIGTKSAIYTALSGGYAELHYDQVHPLGSLLLSCSYDHDWESVLAYLEIAHQIMSPHELLRVLSYRSPKPYEAKAQEILEQKRTSGNPLYEYVANRIWYGYWPLRDRKKAAQYSEFMDQMKNLIRPFSYTWHKLDVKSRITIDDLFLHEAGSWMQVNNEISIHTIHDGNSALEFVLTSDSLVPLIKYYKDKLDVWKAYSVSCKVCRKTFAAPNLHHALCSDPCKHISKKIKNTVRLQDDLTRSIDRLCHAVDATWNNRLRKIRNLSNWSEDDVRQYEIEKEHYQEKKRKMRQNCKHGIITYSELQNWLFKQQCYAEALIQEHNTKNT